MTSHRPLLAALALGTAIVTPSAVAAPVDVGAFAGTFHTTCTMPSDVTGPKSGWYSCTHTARALGCAGVADNGAPTTWATTCRADLARAKTRGLATNTAAGYALWTCDNGAGAGTFAYRPSPTEPTFRIPVTLVVLGHTVIVNGTYTPRGTSRTMVVRARFPAVCSWGTQVDGYEGTVTPA